MASGKQSKRRRQQARTPPPVQRKGQRRAASPKILIAVAAAIVIVGAAVGSTLALTGGSSSSSHVNTRGSLADALPSAAVVQRLFRGIPQHGTVLGSPRAPVTLIEYIDLQCPGCQAFETQVFPSLVSRYVRTGKLKVDARPIAFIGPDSERGRLAAIAAAGQNKFFNYTELLYFNQGAENSGWLDDNMVKAAAASIPGVDVAKLLAARKSASVSGQTQIYDAQASSDQVTGTPTILVGKSGARAQKVVASLDTIAAAISAASRA